MADKPNARKTTSKKPATGAKKPQAPKPVIGKYGAGHRPTFVPRVVFKLADWVDVEYVDDTQKQVFEKYGAGPLAQREDEVRFERLVTVLDADELRRLVERARQTDDTYKGHRFDRWFTMDTPRRWKTDDLVKAMLEWDIVELAHRDDPAIDPVVPGNDPRSPNQGYLDAAPTGIDAEFAWTVAGGDGAGQRFVDLEQGWTLNHEDLNAHGATLLFGTLVDTSRAHGTSVLGEVCAVDNTIGCVGIVPAIASVDVTGHSGSFANMDDAIIAALPTMSFGDVLLLEVQSSALAPIEVLDDVFEAIRLATALGIVVVEAAGNGANNLNTITSGGLQVLNPASVNFRDSGAIIVGAASSAAPHTRNATSSFGARVDCYAWGQNVDTTSSTTAGSTTSYTATFNGTSSASPIVTGAALAVQGLLQAAGSSRLSPLQMRNVLSNLATSTASNNPAVDQIGVMPNLRAIIDNTIGTTIPDVYIRDNPADVGDPHTGPISTSPDIIVRPTSVANPQTAYGEGSGTEGDSTLGYEVAPSQNNFIYTRLRNRGSAASSANVQVFWSPVSTLVTPDLWTLAGTSTYASVPTGNLLTVGSEIVWAAADIPAAGHYCYVGIVDSPGDPAPLLTDLVNFDNFRTFIRNNNNATWRNFNVVATDPADPTLQQPFLIAGALDRRVEMQFEVIANLPHAARLTLHAPEFALVDQRDKPGAIKQGEVRLRPRGRQDLGRFLFPAKYKAELWFEIDLPKHDRKTTGYSVTVRQLLAETGEELGRVTWYLAAPDWFERRQRREKCLFG